MVARVIEAADLFCGAGGSSEGLVQACRETGRRVNLVAVNHSPIAVASHRANHPSARHFCQDIRKVKPREAVPSGHLDILMAGAPCPHFSPARGGRPMDDYERSTPKEILRWLEDLDVENVLIENIPAFTTWGPLIQKTDRDGKPMFDPKTGKPWMVPDPAHKGEDYDKFTSRIRRLGYTVEARVLNAADYGAATSRRRLFIMARKGRPVVWPEPSHTPENYRAARDIIDWDLEGTSIFERKKPLADKTLARIAEGIRRFCGEWSGAFLAMMYGTGTARSIELPLPTVTAGGGKGGGHIALCEFLLQQQSGGVARPVDQPGPTVAARGAQSLVRTVLVPFYGERKGQEPRTHSVDRPCPTIPASGDGKFGKVDFVVQVNHGGGHSGRIHGVDGPLKTTTSKNGFALVENFIVKYFGTGVPHGVDEPAPTVTTKDRIGLVQCGETVYGLDIRFRMLQPHELQAAMSFPKEYRFVGTRSDVVRQIGNAWDCRTGKALCGAMLSDLKVMEKGYQLALASAGA